MISFSSATNIIGITEKLNYEIGQSDLQQILNNIRSPQFIPNTIAK